MPQKETLLENQPQTDKPTERLTDKLTERLTDRVTDRLTDRLTTETIMRPFLSRTHTGKAHNTHIHIAHMRFGTKEIRG